jgi:SAM-dependent methyltransferase
MTGTATIRTLPSMTSPAAPPVLSTDPTNYALGRSTAEAERLQLQHQIYGGATRSLFVGAGIGPGMRVLDIGSGAGDVALLAADLVGPTGEVVGVEVAPETIAIADGRVAGAGLSNVRFVCADLRDLGDVLRDEGPFDAIVGRWVLMYQPDPADLLRRLVAFAAPGAVIAFQESDLLGMAPAAVPTPVHDHLREVMLPPQELGGPEQRMGPKLYRAFVAAGLPAPTVRIDTPVGGGPDWPGYGYLAATARSLLPMFVAMGAVADGAIDVDTLEERLRDEIVSQDGVQPLVPVYGAATRLD